MVPLLHRAAITNFVFFENPVTKIAVQHVPKSDETI